MFLIALSPILWLAVALCVLHMQPHKACLLALLLSVVVGIGLYDMTTIHAFQAFLEGVALACWPILLVIIAAIFTYNLSEHTKGMDGIKKMLTSVSNDRRVLILLIGWGFGGFMEGMAGFGTAIAIPASMLVGIPSLPPASAWSPTPSRRLMAPSASLWLRWAMLQAPMLPPLPPTPACSWHR